MFPEALKLLPLYTLSLLKQRIFHVRTLCPPSRLAKPTETLALALQTKGDVPFDERAALISRAETLSVPLSTAYNYAHAFKIDSLAPDTGTEVNGQVVVPVRRRRPPKPCAKCAIAG